MMSIRLERRMDVRCWRVIGQIARAAKRDELIPVLLRARERGTTDAEDVAGHLLFEPSARRVVGERLLQIAERYGLLERRDRRYGLTESGHTALATRQVFVPEHGTWSVWASQDPLLTTPVLRVAPWTEPLAYDEVRGRERDTNRTFEKLPRWLRDAVGVVSLPLAGGAEPLRIDHLEGEGEAAEPECTLRAAWDVSGARLRVDGELGGARVDAALDAPELDADNVWMQLLESARLWSQWDPNAQVLRVGFEGAAPDERESMVRGVVFGSPSIAGLGEFDDTRVDGVAVGARSEPDARRWAQWRLLARVREYATEERFGAWTAEAVAPFAEFQPRMPTRQALVAAARREREDDSSPQFPWHLVAAEDWRL